MFNFFLNKLHYVINIFQPTTNMYREHSGRVFVYVNIVLASTEPSCCQYAPIRTNMCQYAPIRNLTPDTVVTKHTPGCLLVFLGEIDSDFNGTSAFLHIRTYFLLASHRLSVSFLCLPRPFLIPIVSLSVSISLFSSRNRRRRRRPPTKVRHLFLT